MNTTAIQVKAAEITHNVVKKPAILQIYVPKINFNNKGIKWYEDKKRSKL